MFAKGFFEKSDLTMEYLNTEFLFGLPLHLPEFKYKNKYE